MRIHCTGCGDVNITDLFYVYVVFDLSLLYCLLVV